ncbi:MAG: endonuclease domain-containing protein [Actinomycetota bacterium]|nr:endonuclease domain-containing protein [Actinomycetota bacterium]
MDQHNDASRTHRTPDARIAAIAARQHSAFSRQQAFDVGFTRGMINRRQTSQRWLTADYSVYRFAGTARSWHQRLMAACLAGPAVASHRAAGALWGFPDMLAEIVEVTALRHRRRRAADVIWHESYHLIERDITEIAGIPVTRPVRTFLDLGVVLSSAQLEAVLDAGLRLNLLDIAAVWRRLDQLGELRPGARAVRDVLDSRVAGECPTESVLENRFRQVLRSAGVPLPAPQVEVRAGSTIIARIDFAYPELKVGFELDGAAYHASEEARRRDRSRDNRLGTVGWRILRFTWEDLRDRSDAVIASVDACVKQHNDA